MESSPLRVNPLLSISSSCRGILFYRYRERARGRLVLENEVVKKAGVAVRSTMVVLVRESLPSL